MARARFLCVAVPSGEQVAFVTPRLWRLIGPNNRELGRMPLSRAGVSTCCEAAEFLQSGVGRAVPRVKRGTGRGVGAERVGGGAVWTWTLEIDGVPAAASGRSYIRQRECQYSLAHFLAAVPTAGYGCEWRPVVGSEPAL